MSPNLIPVTPGESPRAGQLLRMASLAPQFDEERHQLYYDLLIRAVDADGTYNVAVTGAYGTGKSSVLEQLRKDRKDDVVALSLSTITPENTGEESRTNQIQKEIVKQLLYRLPTRRTPRSRFRRTSAPDRGREWVIAGLTGLALLAVAVGLGIVHPIVQDLFDVVWRQVLAYLLLAGALVAGAWSFGKLVRVRPALAASVNAGPATVTLSEEDASESYFDKYLDEIVYFFQVSRRYIVVIEDIDRFDHVHVFDTLRALNSLLNGSEQIGRRVVFVYAIRDSVFDQIGGTADDDEPKTADNDRAKATLKLASRTKFFDVIIPVVPFVSADNARDLMSTAMKSDDFTIDPALIRLAARHVADMRMIHNIRNEFEVYRQMLVVPDRRMPGIDDDLVFALVLYKNTHLADFELIRRQDSTLDTLYLKWRELVRVNTAAQTKELATLRHSVYLEETADSRAADLGRRLVELSRTLGLGARDVNRAATVQLVGIATDQSAGDRATWAAVAAGQAVEIAVSTPWNSVTLAFSGEQLGRLLGAPIDPAMWQAADLQEGKTKIADVESRLDFLRHHTWEMLCKHPEFTLPVTHEKPDAGRTSDGSGPGGPSSFSELVNEVLTSDLARDLVHHGFLTSHFALYASSYYGEHLGPDAAEYIRRCIEPGTPDATFALDDESILQILREQQADDSDDADLFSDVSVYNVSIVDYLHDQRPGAAAAVARQLSRLGEHESAFVDVYTAQGKHAARLLAAMTPTWPGVVCYAAGAPVDSRARVGLIDAVLQALPRDAYEVDEAVRQLIETNYRDIEAIARPSTAVRAGIVLRVVKASGASLDELEPLNDAARDVAVELKLFPITEANLQLFARDDSIALDVLRVSDRRVYSLAVDRLEDYLVAFGASATTTHTVTDPRVFEAIVTDAAENVADALLGRLIDAADVACRVPTLSTVPTAAWPFLVAADRTDATLDNVKGYIDELGLDDHLGSFIAEHTQITFETAASEADRLEIAVRILNARGTIRSTESRVTAAASLQPGLIPATAIESEQGDLIARLLAAGLIADDATAFSTDLMVDWSTFEAAIAASQNFAAFVSPDILDVALLPNLLHSTLPGLVQRAVVNDLADYLTAATPQQVHAVARALADHGWKIRRPRIEALRAAGAAPGEIVRLIEHEGDRLTAEDVKSLLGAMGEPYSLVAQRGWRKPNFPDDPAHRYVLGRLVRDTISRVEAETVRGKGRRLVAYLHRPKV